MTPENLIFMPTILACDGDHISFTSESPRQQELLLLPHIFDYGLCHNFDLGFIKFYTASQNFDFQSPQWKGRKWASVSSTYNRWLSLDTYSEFAVAGLLCLVHLPTRFSTAAQCSSFSSDFQKSCKDKIWNISTLKCLKQHNLCYIFCWVYISQNLPSNVQTMCVTVCFIWSPVAISQSEEESRRMWLNILLLT